MTGKVRRSMSPTTHARVWGSAIFTAWILAYATIAAGIYYAVHGEFVETFMWAIVGAAAGIAIRLLWDRLRRRP